MTTHNNGITALVHSGTGVPPVASFRYAYDNEGNKLYEEKRHNTSRSQAYQYDVLNRLVDYRVGTLAGNTIPAPISESVFNLDPVGNWNSRVQDGVTENRTHNNANEITAINSGAVTHDNNGNLTAYSTKTFAYDEANRLVVASAVPSGVLGEYVYDALGRRVIKRASASGTTIETRYLYDGARIIEEQDVTGATIASYAYGNYVDEVLQRISTYHLPSTIYYHQNSLWHVIAVTDAQGAIVERYSFDAYGYISITDGNGNAIPNNSWGTAHSAIGNPWTYTGRQFDEETGLYYYRARYYDQAKGRFLQRDPLGYVDGMNLYEYVRSNPSIGTDPSGLDFQAWSGIGYVPPTRQVSGPTKQQRMARILDVSNCVLRMLMELIDKNGMYQGRLANVLLHYPSDSQERWNRWLKPMANYYLQNWSRPENWWSSESLPGSFGYNVLGFHPVLGLRDAEEAISQDNVIDVVDTLLHEPQHQWSQRGPGHTELEPGYYGSWSPAHGPSYLNWERQLQKLLLDAQNTAMQTRHEPASCCVKTQKEIVTEWDYIRCECGAN